MRTVAMLPHASVTSPAFIVLVAVLVVLVIALVVRLWGPAWWKSGPPRK
jgi:hypothetical protein